MQNDAVTLSAFETIQRYYDERIDRKIGDFTNSNPRIEAAVKTSFDWVPNNAASILEIGCGIGATAWRIAQAYRNANVLGVDISQRSIDVARTCFRLPNLAYQQHVLSRGVLAQKFDYVLMMDVYEHIAAGQRSELHQFLAEALTENGRVFLSFPTPWHLQFLRMNNPDEIQPVDEDVTPEVLSRLAADIAGRLLAYWEVSIWHIADYAHAIVGRDRAMISLPGAGANAGSRLGLGKLKRNAGLRVSKRKRLKLMRQWYDLGNA